MPANLNEALAACDFPIAVWEYPDGIVRLANQPAAELLGVTINKFVGQRMVDIFTPREFVDITSAAIGSMAVDSVQSDRRIQRPDGTSAPVRIWSRAIQVNGLNYTVSLIIPLAEIGRLGRDPAAPWRDLAPIAVGILDRHWRIERVSRDIQNITGIEASDYAGVSLLSILHPEDAARLSNRAWRPGSTVAACNRLRLRRRGGTWMPFCFLVGPMGGDQPDRSAFAVIASPEPDPLWLEGRVSELERRLRHIGAEVRASGVLGVIESLPTAPVALHMADLSSRQLEILGRLARGDRVPTIASDLYLSQSTVRNHLAVIFRRFGVHSQAELLETLRRPPPGEPVGS